MQGWIKLHRKILTSNIFQNEKLLKVFIYCLTKASHAEYEQKVGRQKVLLKPGQFVTGRKKAALELDMKESTVRDYLNLLKDDNVIDIKTTNRFSIVTIVNWGFYQSKEDSPDNKNDSKRTAKGQQINTNKNGKNDKKIDDDKSTNAFTFYQQNFGVANPVVLQSINMWIDDMSEEIVIEAMITGLKNNARSFSYCETILKNWYSEGIRSMQDLEAQQTKKKFPNVTPFARKKDNLQMLDEIARKLGYREDAK